MAEDDWHPGMVLPFFQTIKWLPEPQVTDDVKGRKVELFHHVYNHIISMNHRFLSQFRNKLISTALNQPTCSGCPSQW